MKFLTFLIASLIIKLFGAEYAADESNFDFQTKDVEERSKDVKVLFNEHSFANLFEQEAQRRMYAVECPIDKSQINFFEITVKIVPSTIDVCPLADQVLLGNNINNILVKYGIGEEGKYDDSVFLAGVCSTPSTSSRRILSRSRGYVWLGFGGCAKVMCTGDNKDNRRLQSAWFYSTFKPQMEATLGSALLNEVAPNYSTCLGINPTIEVTITGKTLSEVLSIQCSSSIGFLESTSIADFQLAFNNTQYGSCVKLDFSTKGDGSLLQKGAYVKDEWKDKYGIVVTAAAKKGSGYTPGGMARIYDTAKSKADPDLGSPNEKCIGGGPGKGRGGEPGKLGENCKAIGNVLIIQESNIREPDDNASGGNITFDFLKPVFFNDIGMMDIDEKMQTLSFTLLDRVETYTYTGFGDNGVQRVIANKGKVKKLVVAFPQSGAITEINFCPSL